MSKAKIANGDAAVLANKKKTPAAGISAACN
jgi:hypothetical protein